MRATAPLVVALLAGCQPPPVATGAAPLWSDDALSLDNPFPDERLGPELRPDWAFPFMPAAANTFDAEQTFDRWRPFLVDNDGWGTYAPVYLRFSEKPEQARVRFLALEDDVVVDGVTSWVADPGYLLARPARPLPARARVAVVVTGAARPAAFDAHARAAGQDDVAHAARLLGVAAERISLLVPYRTADAPSGLERARAALLARVPAASFDPPALVRGRRVVEGRFASLDLRRDGVWGDEATPIELGITAVLPDTAPPWPAAIVQHGFAGDRSFVVDFARAYVERGMAVFGIDASSHGARGSFLGFLRVDDPRIARDHLRQTALDLVQLTTLLQRGVDVDGTPGNDLDGTVRYFGHSMGALVGGALFPAEPRIEAAVLNAPGASFFDIFRGERLNSAVSLLLRPALGLGIDDPAYDDAVLFCGGVLQTLMEPADPIALAARRSPLLLQVPLGDRLLPNDATRALASTLELDELRAPPSDAPSALGALWWLDPADFGLDAAEDPHGMHARAPGVHDQAAAFLLTNGHTLVDPR